jgi:serine/threonine protein kinase/tetratricopeptide (TPR) repeat protein
MIGQTLSHYRILSRIGAGGMGEVYLAEDTRLGRKVALKILRADFTQDEDRVRRFEQEARAASALSHPNILTIFDIGQDGSTHFIGTEFIEGETLRRILQRGRLEAEQSIEIATQIVAALQAAHRSGIVHRDIKPENIMVRSDGLVKVLDFGLAKLNETKDREPVEPEGPTRILFKTMPGLVMGTATHMSPEQVRGNEVDERSDIFSFGVVMYEMLVGQLPFTGDTMSDVIAAILKADPPTPRSLNRKLPTELDRIVSKALAKDREQRYQTATDLLDDLRCAQRRLLHGSEGIRESGVQSSPSESALAGTQDAGSEPRAGVTSLAVLPFTNAGGDPEMEYLSDGLTESVIFGLSQLPEIQVVARSTVFRHKGSEEDFLDIGRTLGAGAIVTGRVRQRGATLLISAELIDVNSGYQLWGAQYRRAFKDLCDVEDEIANEISRKLSLKLSPERQKALDRRRTDNIEAYHLYLKARFYWGKRTEESLYRALQLFRQALDADPTYALAYAGVAEGYTPLAFYCHLSPKEAVPKAKAAAERALEIEPELPEALAVLGSMRAHYDWDMSGAEALLRKAVALDPRYPRARQALAECLTMNARFDEAIIETETALGLDPLSLHMNAAMVMHNYFARRQDDAISHGRQAVELDPSFFPTHLFLGLAYQASGRLVEAVSELQQARGLSADSTLVTATLAGALAASGKNDEANDVLDRLEEIRRSRYVSQTATAAAYACMQDAEQTLSGLEKAYEDRCLWLPYALTSDSRFDTLRGEPRFQSLAQRYSGGAR